MRVRARMHTVQNPKLESMLTIKLKKETALSPELNRALLVKKALLCHSCHPQKANWCMEFVKDSVTQCSAEGWERRAGQSPGNKVKWRALAALPTN